MALKVEHELHQRRKGRNYGVLLILLALIGIVFGLTVVKALNLDDVRELEGFDHVSPTPLATGPEGGTE